MMNPFTPPVYAGTPGFSDPAHTMPPPDSAIGWPRRDTKLDAWPGFKRPPAGYGEVAFYWWLGDPLTKRRITWQIKQLSNKGVMGLQINYAHSDQGGAFRGLTYPSDPPLFSSAWWKLVQWFAAEAKKHDIAVSLSDYTLNRPGQGWYLDEILKEDPALHGSLLEHTVFDVPGGGDWRAETPEGVVGAVGYRVSDGALAPESAMDLRGGIRDRILTWHVPEGTWKAVVVYARAVPSSIDPLDPKLGRMLIEKFFKRMEDRLPKKTLNFFFSDELGFGLRGYLWHARFAREFRARKGYDVVPELAALFLDVGPRTPKIRLDYTDVMVALEEESYFRPLFDWHQERGMIYGCDHGGRGTDVTELGDYFRTQRWNQGPGCDQPRLSNNLIQNKVASSIAHLYLRPRVWLEGYYGSGWGTTTAQLTDATFRNFIMGQNLLTLHGLYYSLHGGWWEWAPPCNHFRMPYWAHMGKFMDCIQRLSYLLSQGYHRCDVAIIYPVAPMEAGMDGQVAVNTAFGAGEHLYGRGMDFDFMDFESLARTEIRNKKLCVSGEEYRVLILPAMKALRHSTIQKAAEFYRAGGLVIALEALPEASDRAGRDDAALDALVKEIFGLTAGEAANIKAPRINRNHAGGLAALVQKAGQAEEIINRAFPRDFVARDDAGQPFVTHRKVGRRDVYAVYGVPKNTECFFRARGKMELWDPWTGATRPLTAASQTAEGVTLKMPLGAKEVQLIIFSPGAVEIGAPAEKAPTVVKIEGDWEFELQPTMDNRWGDFRWPAFKGLIGAEMRQIRYADEVAPEPGYQDPDFDDAPWPKVTYSYGPKFWKLGPLPEDADMGALEERLAALRRIDPVIPIEVGGKKYRWQTYEFSWRFGLEHDAAHQGYHGLKGEIADEFVGLGALKSVKVGTVREKEEGGTRYYLWTSVPSAGDTQTRVLMGGMQPGAVWLNSARMAKMPETVNLKAGSNPLLLRYDAPGRGFVVFATGKAAAPSPVKPELSPLNTPVFKVSPLAMSWHNQPGILPFDTRPGEAQPAGWYRFRSPPGLRSMTITAHGKAQVWVAGKVLNVRGAKKNKDGSRAWTARLKKPMTGPVKVAIRIEQERGCYGGAALPEPITLDCGAGRIALGDWSEIDGLASYSGGAWYRKIFNLDDGVPSRSARSAKGGGAQAGGLERVCLDLGNVVASAEVHVNGKLAGVKVAPPWKIDISRYVKKGANRLEVKVYNTLANHYSTIPTNYRGSPVSGLLGPVSVELD